MWLNRQQTTSTQVASTINKHASKDAYGYSLSYYDDDYKATNTGFLNHSEGANPNLTADLYNGNIRGMFTTLSDQNEAPIGTHQTNYTYDQLNRIKSMTGYDRTVGQTATASGYSSNYSFDANGNLLTLQRECTLYTILQQNRSNIDYLSDSARLHLFYVISFKD